MIFPLNRIGLSFPELKINAELIIDSKYIICGVIFLIAAVLFEVDAPVTNLPCPFYKTLNLDNF